MSTLQLLAAVLLLAGNAFFVGAEFAIVSVRRTQLEGLAATSRRARRVLAAQRELSLLLAAAQLGITICSLGLGAVAEPAVAHLLEGALEVVHVPEGVLHPLAFAVALTLVVFLHMVLGEMVPKNLAIAGPQRAALLLTPLLLAFMRATSAVIRSLNAIADLILRALHVQPISENDTAYTPEQLVGIVDESSAEGALSESDTERLRTALALRDRRAADVMIALDRMETVPTGVTAEALEEIVARTGLSRFPVRGEVPGSLVGFVHAKDVLGVARSALAEPLPGDRVRPLPEIPADLPLPEVLTRLQRSGSHLAQVRQEERLVGLLALEDVVEEFVGEVRDATHDEAEMVAGGQTGGGTAFSTPPATSPSTRAPRATR